MRLITARFALVQWPDKPQHESLCCITLDSVADAVMRGAILIGREDTIIEEAIPAFSNPPRITDSNSTEDRACD